MLVNLMSELMAGYNSIHEDMECNCPCSCSSSRNSWKKTREKGIWSHSLSFSLVPAGMDWLGNCNSIFVLTGLKKITFYVVFSAFLHYLKHSSCISFPSRPFPSDCSQIFQFPGKCHNPTPEALSTPSEIKKKTPHMEYHP